MEEPKKFDLMKAINDTIYHLIGAATVVESVPPSTIIAIDFYKTDKFSCPRIHVMPDALHDAGIDFTKWQNESAGIGVKRYFTIINGCEVFCLLGD